MKTPLILSVAAAAVLSISLHADDTSDRMQAMEAQIKALQSQLDALKETKASKGDTEEADDEAADGKADETADEEEEDDTKERLDDLEEQVSNINKNTAGSHLKFGIDFRTSVDNLQYKMADGSTQSNDALLANRLWVNMNWAATDNISFTGQLAYNKFYGSRSGFGGYPAFETFDWIVNENPYDDIVRVRSAYFFYRDDTFLGADVPWTFSLGRRPSTNGHLINYRDDDPAASPMGHTINVEFDGLSAKFTLENVTGVPGMYAKFCAGRGGTNANAKFFTVQTENNNTVSVSAPYASNSEDIPDIDLAGLIFVPYDDGQYSLNTQYYYAANLIGAVITPSYQFEGMEAVGNLQSFTANIIVNGIGDGWSDFLDDTLFFVSGAWSFTDPKSGMRMLGSDKSEMGSSYWVGLQTPTGFSEMGRFGFEFNHGDKYWRSITYAEDTDIGSKVAARGNAYEAYYTDYLIDDVFSFQLRYTYIDYDYAGSNNFFGDTGTPYSIDDVKSGMYGSAMAASTVDTAQDIRFYLRYRY